jgi:hypothetical protein
MGESFPKILSPLLKLVDHVLLLRSQKNVHIIIRMITFKRLSSGTCLRLKKIRNTAVY